MHGTTYCSLWTVKTKKMFWFKTIAFLPSPPQNSLFLTSRHHISSPCSCDLVEALVHVRDLSEAPVAPSYLLMTSWCPCKLCRDHPFSLLLAAALFKRSCWHFRDYYYLPTYLLVSIWLLTTMSSEDIRHTFDSMILEHFFYYHET